MSNMGKVLSFVKPDKSRLPLASSLVFLFVGTFLFLNPFSSSVGAKITDPSSVGYWKFDEGSGDVAGDSSGNENDGTLVNNPTWVSGLLGQALEFDGVDDYVTIPDSPSLDINGAGITFMAWIYSPGFQDYGWIMGKGQSGPWDDMVWWLLPRSNGAIRYGIKSGGSTIERLDIPVGLAINTWQHVAVVYDGSYMRFYLNGVERDSYPKTGNLDVNDAPILIGLDGWSPTNHYRGKIDEVKIYNRALSPEEINMERNGACVPGDVNNDGRVIGSDVTYLVNYFRGGPPPPFRIETPNGPFYPAADVNGDCRVIGSDVTYLVNYFRGINPTIKYCPDYPPTWLTPADCPEEAPAGWPNCETPAVTGKIRSGEKGSK